ncbi:serpin A9, partial [Sigmodon hispidus]
MGSFFYRVLLLVGFTAPIFCMSSSNSSPQDKKSPGPPSMKSNPTSKVSPSNTMFAFFLYQRLVQESPGQNVLFSPVSISTSLAMLSLGARSATKTQILRSLGFDLKNIPESTIHLGFEHLVHSLNVCHKDRDLRMGSVLFIRKELQLQANFLDQVKKLYGTKVFSEDFSNTATAQARINSYVEKETKGKVLDVIQDLDSHTTMVLVNHIFFKANWTQPFSAANTIKSFPFLLSEGSTVHVPMMQQTELFAFGVDRELGCSVLKMDYRGDAVAFFVLPGKGRMWQLEKSLSARRLRKWNRSLQKRWIKVFIPKFSISASYNLETVLPKMGIRDAFDANADFSGITKTHFLQVSKVAHKAVLDVSEEGTEAAAATATKLIVRSKDSPSSVISFNQPFLMLLLEKSTESLLFLGKVENPTKMKTTSVSNKTGDWLSWLRGRNILMSIVDHGTDMGGALMLWLQSCAHPGDFSKMGPLWLWLLVAQVLLPVCCQPFSAHGEKSLGMPQPADYQLLQPAPAHHKVTPTITNFALRLYKQLAEDAPGNIIFSPVSLSSVVALLSLGAPPDTQTRILESLGFNLTETPAADIHRGFQSLLRTLDLPSPKLELKVGLSLFLDRQLKPQQCFLDSAKELYGALAFSANFTDAAATGQQINDLVRKQTYGQVVGCLPEFDQDTFMVLLNYIFFKAKWKHPFDRYQTRKQESFFLGQRTALHIPMMRQKEMHRFLYDQEASCTVLQIEYSGTALLLLVLPDPGKMQQVEAALQPETLRRWGQRFLPSLLDLHLPRFSISATYNLEKILPLIGLGNMFDKEADLSGILGQLNKTVSR